MCLFGKAVWPIYPAQKGSCPEPPPEISATFPLSIWISIVNLWQGTKCYDKESKHIHMKIFYTKASPAPWQPPDDPAGVEDQGGGWRALLGPRPLPSQGCHYKLLKPPFEQIQRVSSQVKVFTDTQDITPPVDKFLAGHLFWVLKLQAKLLTTRGCLLSPV